MATSTSAPLRTKCTSCFSLDYHLTHHLDSAPNHTTCPRHTPIPAYPSSPTAYPCSLPPNSPYSLALAPPNTPHPLRPLTPSGRREAPVPPAYPASAHKAELQQVVVVELGSMEADAGAAAAFQGADAVFCCLGTTRAVGETHSRPTAALNSEFQTRVLNTLYIYRLLRTPVCIYIYI